MTGLDLAALCSGRPRLSDNEQQRRRGDQDGAERETVQAGIPHLQRPHRMPPSSIGGVIAGEASA